jgi:Iap family predicted aminopeptidase
MSDDTKIKLLVDVKSRRPGCVLLQAVAGGDNHFVSATFDTRHWLLSPTENMGMVTGTVAQWRKLAKELDKTHNPV